MSSILVSPSPAAPIALYDLTGEQPSHYFLAGPPGGGTDNPYFRRIETADLPVSTLLLYGSPALWAGESLVVLDSSPAFVALTLPGGLDGAELDIVAKSVVNGNAVYLSGSPVLYNGSVYNSGFTLSSQGSSVRLRSFGSVWYVAGAPVSVVFS